MAYKTIEEMQDDESLCEFCIAEPGWHTGYGGSPCCCEGAYCGEAYESYLDENGITERIVEISKKTKITIERN